MTALVTDPGTLVTVFPSHTVEKIGYLDAPGGWVAVPYLFCDTLTLRLNAYDEAQLSYEIGAGVFQYGAADFADYQPIAIRGKYIRVTIDDPVNGDIVWIGYVQKDAVARDGVKDVAGVNKFVGQRQSILAVGLEYFLDRNQIDSAIVHDTTRILRPMKFNGGASRSLDPDTAPRGNRHATTNADSYYSFTNDPENGELFTATHVVEHLLKYHQPLDKDGNPAPCLYMLDNVDNLAGFLDGFYPTQPTDNVTTFECLNQVISPKRGLSWWLEIVEGSPTEAHVRVASAAITAITLPGGETFPASTNKIELNFDAEVDVKRVEIGDHGSRHYHRVVARGAHMTSTFTVSQELNQGLDIDWDTTIQLEWSGEPASGDADYAGLASDTKRAERNDAVRRRPKYDRQFCYFRIPVAWDMDVSFTSVGDWAFPTLDASGNITGKLDVSVQGLRLLNHTRLKEGWDYSDPDNPVSTTPDGTLPDLLRPFAIVKVEARAADTGAEPPVTAEDYYQFADKLSTAKYNKGTPVSPNIKTSYNLRMQDSVPGIILKANGGSQIPLTLGGSLVPSGVPETTFKPEVQQFTIYATVCAEADLYCEGQYAVTPLPANTPIEELVIECGDQYRLDFLAKGTVVDLNGGVQVKTTVSAVLRDDRPALRNLARFAFEWYREDRRKLTVEFRQLRNLFELGMLITTIGAGTTQTTVNTLVSSITYDVRNGTMTIATDDDHFDARRMTS